MQIITLATRARRRNHIKIVEKILKGKFENLKVEIKICGITPNNWVIASISGEDQKVALSYVSKEIGICPNLVEDIKKFSTLKGYTTRINENNIVVDLGISTKPEPYATVNLTYLRAALADGRKMKIREITDLYGICESFPLNIKVINWKNGEGAIEAIFAEKQIRMYRNWIETFLDRIIVLGATQEEIMLAIKTTKLARDVIMTEPLGVFEHVLTCKLGTSAEGLIPKLGKQLSDASLTVFSPKRILKLFGEQAIQ